MAEPGRELRWRNTGPHQTGTRNTGAANSGVRRAPMVRLVWLLLTLAVAIVILQFGRWLIGDPLSSLPVAAGVPTVVAQTAEPQGARRLRHVILADAALGRIGLALSLPEPLAPTPLPLLIVLGGLGTGADTLRYVPDAGPNALIGYDWPIDAALPRGNALFAKAPALYHDLLTAPGQVAAAIDWLAGQDWADPRRISLLGFSLGALLAPSAQRLAAAAGHPIGWTILAYGGAPLGALVAQHPGIPSLWPGDWLRGLLAAGADLAFRPLEPTLHLPRLRGRFLLLGGRSDRLIPAAAFARLRDAVPEPKSVILFEGDHLVLGSNWPDLQARLVSAGRDWLSAEGAITKP
ncbi:MAG: hypothetical protein GC191_06620 [Azospirillum sp.]|nr:hypothetical protein [Azospirillum sp.]